MAENTFANLGVRVVSIELFESVFEMTDNAWQYRHKKITLHEMEALFAKWESS